MLIIDDKNWKSYVDEANANDKYGRGLVPRDFDKQPFGSMQFASAFDLPLIPREEWKERIAEMEAKKQRLSDQVDYFKIKVKNQSQTNYCFPAGTLIRMADGTQVPIENVKTRDEVLTAEGNIRRVRATSVRPVQEPLHRLCLFGHRHLRATSEHPILTKRGYVAIKDVQPGDMVAVPRYLPQTESFLMTGDYLFEKNHAPQSRKKYRTYGKGPSTNTYEVGIPGKSTAVLSHCPPPDIVGMTEGFGRIVGLYLAEGHTGSQTVHWSFNKSEEHTLAEELVRLLDSELGVVARKRVRQNVCQVSISGKQWADLFNAWFGRGSGNKQLPKEMASGPKEFLENVLYGWLDGDRKQGTSAVTVCQGLALNMFDIANYLGYCPTLTTHQNAKVGKDGIRRKHSWMVKWSPDVTPHYSRIKEENCTWRRVQKVTTEDFEGDVFNFSVEGDNSYVANGIGVHNCWINAPVHCLEIVRAVQGQDYVELSPASCGAIIKQFRNVGGWGTEGLKFLVDKGAVPTSLWPANAIDPRYNTQAANAERHKYRVLEWYELRPRNFDEFMTALFYKIPVAIGLNWWRHEVTALDPVYVNGQFGCRINNSWGTNWGDKGRGILLGNKANPDDAVAPRAVMAS